MICRLLQYRTRPTNTTRRKMCFMPTKCAGIAIQRDICPHWRVIARSAHAARRGNEAVCCNAERSWLRMRDWTDCSMHLPSRRPTVPQPCQSGQCRAAVSHRLKHLPYSNLYDGNGYGICDSAIKRTTLGNGQCEKMRVLGT